MAPKTKKKSKKGTKEKKEKKPEEEKIVVPKEPYYDPIRDAPIADILISLASPYCEAFQVRKEFRVSTKLFMVERFIKDMHGGSIKNIRMCAMNGWIED